MGHSAGAHLIALVTSSDAIQAKFGIAPWLGSVFLDSAALDVEAVMEYRHLPLYDYVFGSDPDYWKQVSPLQVLSRPKPPVLAVCSSKREDSCLDAKHYADKATSLGMNASVLPENLTHREINENLGLRSVYPRSVDAFFTTLRNRKTDSARDK